MKPSKTRFITSDYEKYGNKKVTKRISSKRKNGKMLTKQR